MSDPPDGEKASIYIGPFSYNGYFTPGEIYESEGRFSFSLNGWDESRFFTPFIETWRGISSEESLVGLFERGENLFYFPNRPDVGNQDSMYMGQSARGTAVKVVESYSLAEGRRTVASGRYSHSEGSDSKAYGLASHVEGYGSESYGNYAHAEGYFTSAEHDSTHAEGQQTRAIGQWSHAGGLFSESRGGKSFAHGMNAVASGTAAAAIGQDVSALGDRSVALGLGSSASGYDNFAVGHSAAASGNYSMAEGAYISAKHGYSRVEGISAATTASRQFVWNPGGNAGFYSPKNLTGTFNVNPSGGISGFYVGNKSLSEHIKSESQAETSGKMNVQDPGCTKEGNSTAALGLTAYSSGNQSFANGSRVSAIGGKTLAFGEDIFVNQPRSVAIGYHLSSIGNGESTMVLGRYAISDKPRQLVWNGMVSTKFVPSGGNGTINVNPEGGISGVYVGSRSLDSAIREIVGTSISGKLDSSDPGCELHGSAIAAWGTQTSATGSNAIAFGDRCAATVSCSFSGGKQNEVSGKHSLAYGQNNKIVSGTSMFSFGSRNEISGGSGGNVITVGSDNRASGSLIFIHGSYLSASYNNNVMMGVRAESTDARQFVWNPGSVSSGDAYYRYTPPKKIGSFNINPQSGISGFYIGQNNFLDCVVNAISGMSNDQKQRIREALGIS